MATKPSLALIPSGIKQNKVYSVLPSNGDGDFTFSRNGNATRINKDGFIEEVGSGVPRLNYPLIEGEVSGCPSLLLEPASTNLLTYSEDFTDASWINQNLIVNSNIAISPDGTLNASKIIPTTSNTNHLFQNNGGTANATDITSVFAKADGYDYIQIGSWADGTNYANFDLQNGTVTKLGTTPPTIYGIENIGNGWFRIYANVQASGGGTVGIHLISNGNGAWNETFLGDGTNGVLLWGAQLEAGSYPTSYIPTNGSSVTRSAETANGSGDASTFNSSEGVLMAEISQDNNSFNTISISDGGTSDRVTIVYQNNTIKSILVHDNNVVQLEKSAYLQNSFHKVAIKYTSSNVSLIINGFELLTASRGAFADTLNTLQFAQGNGGNNFYGNTKQIQYFDTALTDAELEELTSWTSFNEMAESQLYSVY